MAKNLPIFSSSGKPSRSILSLAKKHKKPLLIISLSSLLLLVAIVAVTTSVSRSSKNRENASLTAASHPLLRASCSSTLYPELCFSSIAANPSLAASLVSQQDIIEASLNLTILAVEANYFKVKKLIKRKDLTPREECALHDCLIDIDQTLDELKKTYDDLKVYPSNKTLSRQADDLKILMSAAMTDQESCLDGFSHSEADKKVRNVLEKGLVHVDKMLSNALAMICNMTDTRIAVERANSRKLEEEDDEVEDDEFPKWLSAGDRKLLQSPSVKADVTVAADGSGNYKTIAEAVAAAPEKSSKRYVIRIKAGVYRENVEVPKKKTNLMFAGDNRKTTIITASRNVQDGSTTFNSATVAVVGDGFLAQDITFQNTAGPSKGQAVALRVGSDLSAFYRCDMLAYQDTLYVHSLRQFYHSCLVVGTVDFIFGNGAVVLQGCNILARSRDPGQANMVTAQGRSDRNQNTGIVIQNCRIDGTSDLIPVKNSVKTFLGRPWREFSRTVVMKSEITDVIRPEGWSAWSGTFALDTLYYAEYQNRGTGAGTSGRVKWKGFKVITNAAEAEQFAAGRLIAGGSWLQATGFPFTLGL